jgi:hypothetical protein
MDGCLSKLNIKNQLGDENNVMMQTMAIMAKTSLPPPPPLMAMTAKMTK